MTERDEEVLRLRHRISSLEKALLSLAGRDGTGSSCWCDNDGWAQHSDACNRAWSALHPQQHLPP